MAETQAVDRPRRRPDLAVVRRQVDDETFHVVGDPRTNEYTRLGETEHAVFVLLDGTRDLAQISRAFEETTGRVLEEEDLAAFVDSLREGGLVETATFDPRLILAEFRMRERAGRARRQIVSGSASLLRFLPFNPDRQLGWLAERLRWCWSRSAAIWSIALIAAGGVLAFAERDRLGPAFVTSIKASVSAGAGTLAGRLLLLYAVSGVITLIHELGHGLTLKHYGGTVPEMGFALAFFQFPGAYTDTSSSYLLPSRFQRVMVSLAGGYIELVMAGAAVFVWWATPPGDFLNEVALMVLLIGGPLTLLFNWNPLLPFDGYYMAMDLLEAPNLQPNAFAHLGDLIRTKLFRVSAVHPRPAPRLRKVYVIYGTLAWSYLATWMLLVPWFAYLLFSHVVGAVIGALLAAVVTVKFARHPLATLTGFGQHVNAEWRGGHGRRNTLRAVGLSVGVAAAALFFLPLFPTHVHGVATLLPEARREVRAGVAGFVGEIRATGGAHVEAGELLASMENPELEALIAGSRVAIERARAEVALLEATGETGRAAARRAERERAENELRVLLERAGELSLRAPLAGVVIGVRLEDRRGTRLEAGDLWCEVAGLDRLVAFVEVPEIHMADVLQGAPVAGAHDGFPGRRFAGRVHKVPEQGQRIPGPAMAGLAGQGPSPGASYPVEILIDNAEGALRPGMILNVRMEGERMSLAHRAARAGWRLLRGKLWW